VKERALKILRLSYRQHYPRPGLQPGSARWMRVNAAQTLAAGRRLAEPAVAEHL